MSLKPVVVLERSDAENARAFQAYFETLKARFTNVTAINLVDQTGREASIAEAFRTHMSALNDPTHLQFHSTLR